VGGKRKPKKTRRRVCRGKFFRGKKKNEARKERPPRKFWKRKEEEERPKGLGDNRRRSAELEKSVGVKKIEKVR